MKNIDEKKQQPQTARKWRREKTKKRNEKDSFHYIATREAEWDGD